MQKLILICMVLMIAKISFGQIPKMLDPANSVIYSLAEEVTPEGLIYWKCDQLLQGQLFTTYKQHTGLGQYDEMRLEKTWTDAIINMSHKKYQQYYKNILVEGATYKSIIADKMLLLLTVLLQKT